MTSTNLKIEERAYHKTVTFDAIRRFGSTTKTRKQCGPPPLLIKSYIMERQNGYIVHGNVLSGCRAAVYYI